MALSGNVYFESKIAPGKVIDISQRTTQFGRAIIYGYRQTTNQHFSIFPCEETDYYFIQSHMSSKVLTVAGNLNDDGSAIIQEANTNKQSQKFKIEASKEKDYYFIVTFSNKVVDVCQGKDTSETPLIQWSRHGDSNQVWKIVKI